MTLLVLWAAPRTVSTAFERMMIERGDHRVLDEPWSRAYYFGPERRSSRYPLAFPESTYTNVEAGVLATAESGPVFVKDMAYHAAPGITDDALRAMTHTFLIREPSAALRSLLRRWPDFTDDEAGFEAQRALFDRVTSATGEEPAVIDSHAVRTDPDGVVERWCERIGIEHRPDSLSWEPGMRPEWQLWRDWYANVAASTGFSSPGSGEPAESVGTDDSDRVAELLERCEQAIEPLRRAAQSWGATT